MWKMCSILPLEDSLEFLTCITFTVFEIPQVPFAFESEGLNGNSVTKHSLNYDSSDLDKVGQMVEWQFRQNSHRIAIRLFD